MPNVLLGVSGSVAAYRACDLARELMRRGCTVRACLTDGATKFVTPALFEALTGQPALRHAFEEPIPGRMAHIDWARSADAMVVAPATANTLARLAHGIGDDMLSTIALAFTGPLVLAPAMNPSMYASAPVQEAIRRLKPRATAFVEPEQGDVACGEQGQGKLASIELIAETVMRTLSVTKRLQGRTLLITSGPTQEPIDSVRYLSNRSSGKMGAALARAALLMGATVYVVTGPAPEPLPLGAEISRVRTAAEMLARALELLPRADLVIGAAAVADYRPAEPFLGKIRRSEEVADLKLVSNPDVIVELSKAARPGTKLVGFAAEPTHGLEAVREKRARKGLFAIAANDISRAEVGFESEDNELTLVFEEGEPLRSGLRSKLGCALWMLEALVGRLFDTEEG